MTTSTNRRISQGFLPYGSNDESVLLLDPLTAANADATNVTAVGAGGTFDEGGISFAVQNADGQKYDLLGMGLDLDELFNGMTMTVWVEKGVLDHTNVEHQMPFYFYGGAGGIEIAGLRIRTHTDTAADYAELYYDTPQTFSRFNTSSVGKDDYVRFDYCINRGVAKLYIDYILVSTIGTNYIDILNSNFLRYFGLGMPMSVNISANGCAFKAKNLMISNKTIQLSVHPKLRNVLCLGDSMPRRGGYPDGSVNNADNGDQQFAYNDPNTPQQVVFKDAAMMPTIQRELARKGYNVGVKTVSGKNGVVNYNALRDYCEGGSLVSKAHKVNFSSGGVAELLPGDVITGQVSGEEATVAQVFVSGGTWAGANAVGYFTIICDNTVEFTDGEHMDVPGQVDICTHQNTGTLPVVLEVQITLAIETNGEKPNVVVIWTGSNDVTGGWGATAIPTITIDAAWKSLVVEQVNRLIAAGVENILLCEVVYVHDTDFVGVPDANATTLLESRQDAINAYYTEIASEITEVTLIPLFELFGGNTPIDAYYSVDADDRHTNDLGSVEVGKMITQKLIKAINAADTAVYVS